QEVDIAAGGEAVFVTGTAVIAEHLDLGEIGHDHATLLNRQETRRGKATHFLERNGVGKLHADAAAIWENLPGAAAALGHQEVIAHRIIEDTGDRFAVLHHRGHDREERQAA